MLFLRKLVEGGSEHSFGIHVAKMAGMPQIVIQRANKILKKLEKSHSSEELTDKMASLKDDDLQLSFFNLDFLTSLSAAASAISNVGPGLGSIIGPTGNYASIPNEAKWILSITMLIGRLELFTFLVLLSVSFWKK